MNGHHPPGCILIVEEDFQFASSLQKILCKAGYGTFLADTGVEILGLLSTRSFDLVITDCRKGSLYAAEVISCIRRQAIPARILLFTALGDEELAANLQKTGVDVDGCIRKPAKRDEILKCVARLLSHQLSKAL